MWPCCRATVLFGGLWIAEVVSLRTVFAVAARCVYVCDVCCVLCIRVLVHTGETESSHKSTEIPFHVLRHLAAQTILVRLTQEDFVWFGAVILANCFSSEAAKTADARAKDEKRQNISVTCAPHEGLRQKPFLHIHDQHFLRSGFKLLPQDREEQVRFRYLPHVVDCDRFKLAVDAALLPRHTSG